MHKTASKSFTDAADRGSKHKYVPLFFGPACQLSGRSRTFKGLLGERGRILHGKSFDIHFLIDCSSMENNEKIFTST